ncbi:LPXTG cell wall anchor domain-containing protein [Actinoplanes sp. NPDC026619]|uniref:LPXTG cell wall anchor domain-containing protein n=1 Tax=Actinoplanes sp. NPDC026619 TaxID=3155798 RepID=UPI00340AD330
MSATRRILIAGLPSVAVAAALAFAAAPAPAMADTAVRPVVMATPSSDDDSRTKTHYGTVSPTHTRGHGGYGSAAPTTTPAVHPSTTAPSGNVDTVPPTTATTTPGVQDTGTPTPTSSYGGGVSAGHALPVTGAPTGLIVSLGALMVAGGAASVWYTRRRRSA